MYIESYIILFTLDILPQVLNITSITQSVNKTGVYYSFFLHNRVLIRFISDIYFLHRKKLIIPNRSITNFEY